MLGAKATISVGSDNEPMSSKKHLRPPRRNYFDTQLARKQPRIKRLKAGADRGADPFLRKLTFDFAVLSFLSVFKLNVDPSFAEIRLQADRDILHF